MFCGNCGAKYQKEGKFCPSCGSANVNQVETNQGEIPPVPNSQGEVTPTVNNQGTVPPTRNSHGAILPEVNNQGSVPSSAAPNKKKKGGKKWILIPIILLVLGAIAVGVFLLNPGDVIPNIPIFPDLVEEDSIDDIMSALEYEEFQEALRLAWDIDASNQEELEERLRERLDVIVALFLSEEMSHSIALMELDTIEQMGFRGLSSAIAETRQFVDNINASRTAFNTAENLYQQGDFIPAMEYYRLVILEDPNYAAAQAGMERALAGYRSQVQAEADGYIADGNYERAIQVFNNALQIVEGDPVLTEGLSLTRQSHVNTNIAEASRLMGEGEYLQAERVIRDALQMNPENAELLQKQEAILEGYVTATLAEANALLDGGDYAGAVAVIDGALGHVSGNERLTQRRLDIRDSYVSVAIDEANTLLGELNHDGATARINDALRLFPDDDQLTAKRTAIADARPVSIRSITSIDAPLAETSVRIDNYQGEYTEVLRMGWSHGTFVALLDGQYTRLRGILFVEYGERSTRETTTRFELDDRVLETHVMGRTTRPIAIDIDLTDGNELRIFSDARGPWVYFAYFRLYP